jgi:NADH:ubiquinone oxidoreductase subunit C
LNNKAIQNNLIYICSSQFYLLMKINVLDIQFNQLSCLDMSTYNSKILINYFIFTNYFNYFTYIFFLNNHSTINSIAAFFKNTIFLERENTEMFNTKFKNMCDTRNLLLDYTNNEKPLLKYFNVEGFHEIYLNVFTNTLELININYIEL